MLIFTQNLRTN